MKYDDLPNEYRRYSATKGWEKDQAVAYWQQASEFKEFMESRFLASCVTALSVSLFCP